MLARKGSLTYLANNSTQAIFMSEVNLDKLFNVDGLHLTVSMKTHLLNLDFQWMAVAFVSEESGCSLTMNSNEHLKRVLHKQ